MRLDEHVPRKADSTALGFLTNEIDQGGAHQHYPSI
jgi:hypothetical protein